MNEENNNIIPNEPSIPNMESMVPEDTVQTPPSDVIPTPIDTPVQTPTDVQPQVVVNESSVAPAPVATTPVVNTQVVTEPVVQNANQAQPVYNSIPSNIGTVNVPPSKKNNVPLIIGIVIAIFVMIVLILIVGPNLGEKTLNCSKSKEMFGVKMDDNVIIKITGKRIKSMTQIVIYDLSESSIYKNADRELIDETLDYYEKYHRNQPDVKSIDVSRNDLSITITTTADNSIYDGKILESYQKFKEEIEKEGYTCK